MSCYFNKFLCFRPALGTSYTKKGGRDACMQILHFVQILHLDCVQILHMVKSVLDAKMAGFYVL